MTSKDFFLPERDQPSSKALAYLWDLRCVVSAYIQPINYQPYTLFILKSGRREPQKNYHIETTSTYNPVRDPQPHTLKPETNN